MTRGAVHAAPVDRIERGPVRLRVGYCKLYEEGDTVLLTADQGASRLIEIAILPEDARAMARQLLAVADRLDAQ